MIPERVQAVSSRIPAAPERPLVILSGKERGFIVGATRLTKRVWQLYVAHIILFVI